MQPQNNQMQRTKASAGVGASPVIWVEEPEDHRLHPAGLLEEGHRASEVERRVTTPARRRQGAEE